MKRALKIAIPVVIVVSILVAGIWMLLFNRPDLTNQLLINQAENMASHKRYSRAVKYYTWAWSLEPYRDDIPIKLSETYAASGNYTKAEYTLVKAISNQPDLAELYAALCRIYVDQGKLLDAAQMLERITDEQVKQALEEQRPAAPVLLPEGGYYNEYISIEVQSDAPIVFLTSDGEYPSSDADLYTEPVTLSGGETTILAIAVGENGLVSPVTRTGYTVGGVVEAVSLLDPAVNETVRQQLGLALDDELMSDLLWSITHLTLPDTVSDLSDLSKFSGLRSLTINNISGMDFSVLSQVPSLQELDLSGCTISSNALSAIGALVELEKLVLDGCALTDISAFSQLLKLKELSVASNSLEDIGTVSLMTKLESLNVSNNPLSSIAAVSACEHLKYLDISSCNISSLGSLSGKEDLETLLASNNQLRSIKELCDCRHLSVLEISNNQLSDISTLSQLPALTRFEANHNVITQIPDFNEEESMLVYFGINHNEVTDVSGLAGINTLNYINIDYNAVTDLLPVAENYNLIKVNAWDNAITPESVEALASHDIILNYNPNYKAPDSE